MSHSKEHFDTRAKARQTVRTTHPSRMYTQRVPTSFMVARFIARQRRVSVSDWNAALPDYPHTFGGEAWRSNGAGAVVDWGWRTLELKHEPVPPITALELLAPAVARLPRTDAKAEAA